MASAARAFRGNSRRRQAVILANMRRRRDSLRALPKLHQTRYVPIGGPFPDALEVVQDPMAPVTFKTRFIATSVPAGPLITIGTPGAGLSFVGGKLRATVNGSFLDSQFTFVAGVRYDVALAIVPATGRFRAYLEAEEIIDGTATSGPYVSGGNLTLGSAGGINDEGLRVFALHVPQEMLGDAGGAVTPLFDDLLFRAAAHFMGDDQLTPVFIDTP